MKYLILPLIVIAGIGIPIQVAANKKLMEAVNSPSLSILIAFLVGSLALLMLTLSGVTGENRLAGAGSVPWWTWFGGLLSAFVILVSLFGIKQAGTGGVIAATVFGQLTAAIVIDHFGWLGVERIPLNLSRITGAVLLLVGAILVERK